MIDLPTPSGLGSPDAFSVAAFKAKIPYENDALREWAKKKSQQLSRRFGDLGYVCVKNPDDKSGLWFVNGSRATIYARQKLTRVEQERAAKKFISVAGAEKGRQELERDAERLERGRRSAAGKDSITTDKSADKEFARIEG